MAEGGKRIAGRYDLVEQLGAGGMGVVWRARDTRLNRNVAVKVLPASAVGSENARTRLIREAHAAAALEHEGIVRVYDVGEIDGGGAFLVMELVRGQTLREALEKRSFGFAGVLAVIVSAARALGVAHAAGIVHRDVKPDNIMIRDDGRVVVVDFGVAKPVARELLATAAETVAGVTSASITAAGQLVGTPAYLAPEQAKGVEVSAATDQFALAVTAYEALTGKLPWIGDGVVEIVASVLRDHPPPVSDSVPLPPALDEAIARALAKDPAKRWPDMSAFADALDAIADELPSDPSGRPASRPSGKQRAVLSTPKEGGTSANVSRATPDVSALAASVDERTSSQKALGDAASTTASERMLASSAKRSKAPLFYAAVGIALLAGGYAAMHARKPDGGPNAKADETKTDAIACPSFSVSGMDQPWLGSAGAALACEQMQVGRGGQDARTLTPAELSGTAREVIQGIPLDVFEDAGIHDSHVTASKARGARWLEGKIERQLQGFMVEIVLRDPAGGEIARGKGMGPELFEAIRGATKPCLAALGPLDAKASATLKDVLDVESAEDALDLLDVRTAILIEDPTALKESCDIVAKKTTLAPRVMYLAKLACGRKLRTGKPEGPAPALDESTPGALITTSLAQSSEGGQEAVKERAARLERAAEAAQNIEVKSHLLAASAEVYNLVADPRARELARRAIQMSPKAYDWRMSAWHRVAFASEGDVTLGAALQAWQPWEPVAQSLLTKRGLFASPKESGLALSRTYLLSQRGYYANAYGEFLLTQGQIEAARGIAELTKDDLLRVDILLGEAKYGQALKAIPGLINALPAKEEHAAQAFRLAHHGVQAASILGRPADFVDGVVTRYVEAEPHAVVDGVVPFASLVTSCCFAPKAVGKRCIDRLQKLRSEGRLPTIFNGVDRVIEGATHFVAEDYVGAARSWRQLLRAPGWVQEPLRDSLSIAFDRANEPELADEVDAPSLSTVDLPRTAELAWVRAARRAQKRGDNAKARKFAQAVVEKWRFADEDIPAIAEMKALLAKLPP